MFLFCMFIFSVQSKDILQEQIDLLQTESSHMKIEHEKLVADLENLKNKNAEMMEVSFLLYQGYSTLMLFWEVRVVFSP